MSTFHTPIEALKAKKIAYLAIGTSLIALLISTILFFSKKTQNSLDVRKPGMQDILNDSVLKVGYGGFSPYTINDLKDTNTQSKVKGYSIDLVNEIANLSEPKLKVEWVKFNFETLKTDMLSGKFEFIADPVYQTITRARDLGCTQPYAYFGISVGIVKKDDNRFNTFKDLDRSDISISLAEGWTSSEYAKQNLTKPQFKMISVSGDAFNQLDEVLFGRADVALNDVPTIAQYVKAHKDKVKAIFLDNPPSVVPGSFIVPKENQELINFLNTSIEVLKANGTLRKLDEKWKTQGYIPDISAKPGKGFE